jgi:hypothetical protein
MDGEIAALIRIQDYPIRGLFTVFFYSSLEGLLCPDCRGEESDLVGRKRSEAIQSVVLQSAQKGRIRGDVMNADAGVFVLTEANKLVPLQTTSFASENDFQALLAEFPALLAGDQIDTANPRRFLLIDREQPIACEPGGSARWALDHLFIDQDGVPTLAEVKRGDDTRDQARSSGADAGVCGKCDPALARLEAPGAFRCPLRRKRRNR